MDDSTNELNHELRRTLKFLKERIKDVEEEKKRTLAAKNAYITTVAALFLLMMGTIWVLGRII